MTQKSRNEGMLQGHVNQACLLSFSKKISSMCYHAGLCTLFILIGTSTSQSQKQQTPGPWPTVSWSEANPEAVGMDPAILKEAEKIYPSLFPSGYSMMVIRHGYLVSESYYHGQNSKTPNHIYSVTKSFVASLIGVAKQQGWIDGVDQRVADLLPEYQVHQKLEALTLEDVLTHRSGIRNDQSFTDVTLMLKGEPQTTPGTTFAYSNYAPHLLTTILDRQAKQGVGGNASDVPALAQKYLFGPLGVGVSDWKKLPGGVPEGANGLHMTTRDMARLGYLLLRDGRWEDQQILPPGWVQAASEYRVDFDRQKGYGYLNWVRRRPDIIQTAKGEQEKEVQGYFAYGHRGQYIGIYPELDLLVVTMADATDATRDTYFVPDLLHDFVRRFVFPAIIQ